MRSIIVGGGVIGLSIAYETASRGHEVVLVEKDRFGRKASWAGAGILMPVNRQTAIHPMEHLEAIGHQTHRLWSQQLLDQTGIDNGFRDCGGLYIARTNGESAALTGLLLEWKERKIEFEELGTAEFTNRFSHFADSVASRSAYKAVWAPGESQFTNPRHIEALVAGCHKLGVEMKQQCGTARVVATDRKIESISAGSQSYVGDNYFFAAGPWTEELVEPLGLPLPMQPVRGQIAMYKLDPSIPVNAAIAGGPIVNEGSRYLVPRTDGHILAGATIEEVGFQCHTTEEEVAGLRAWAQELAPQLTNSTFVKSWAGLRPGTFDGFPYLGRLGHSGQFENAFVATGHFKTGLQLSPATAMVLADLVEGKPPIVDLKPLSPFRANDV